MSFDSARYWSERYAAGGSSGAGSYGNLAAFKAHFLNAFVAANAVESVVELGCGDGHQLALARYPRYTGFDVAPEAVLACRTRFAGDAGKRFFHTDELNEEALPRYKADMALSLDVLYHLVEEEVYRQYLHRLFALSARHVVIYAPHASFSTGPHVLARPFLRDVDFGVWQLVSRVRNPFPYAAEDENTSFSQFYIFARKPASAVVPAVSDKGLYLLGPDDTEGFRAVSAALISDSLRFASPTELTLNYADALRTVRLLEIGSNEAARQDLANGGLSLEWTRCIPPASSGRPDKPDPSVQPVPPCQASDSMKTIPFDGTRLPFADATFDMVLCEDFLDRAPDPLALLTEVRRVLNPAGRLAGSFAQLEPYHATSLRNHTAYGFAGLTAAAGLRLERLALGPDAPALLRHRMDGRGADCAPALDPASSTAYAAIAEADREIGEDSRITLYKQLLCAGRVAFVCAREQAPAKSFDHALHCIRIAQTENGPRPYVDAAAFTAAHDKIVGELRPLVLRRTPPLVVSLTSYPERIPNLHITLCSLLQQRVRPDKLILWLAESEFPRGEADLPPAVTRLRACGLEIRFCENLRSYKKIIPALQEYPDALLVTADDDWLYTQNWLAGLWRSYERCPRDIHAWRAHQLSLTPEGRLQPYMTWPKELSGAGRDASHLHVFTGCGGVLYPPRSLHPDTILRERFMNLAPTADDLWLWCMATLQGTRVRIVAERGSYMLPILNTTRDDASSLYTLNGPGGQNDVQLAALLQAYPEAARRVGGARSILNRHISKAIYSETTSR